MVKKIIISITLTIAVLAFPVRLLGFTQNIEAVAKIVKGVIFITLLFILMNREQFVQRRKTLRIIPIKILIRLLPVILGICAYVIYFWNNDLKNFDGSIGFLFLTLTGTFIAASAEEVVFRGYLFNLFKKNDYSLLKSLILSSVIFSLVHIANAFRVEDAWAVCNQIIFAFALGMLLGSVYALTNNLLLVCIFHFLINIPSSVKRITVSTANDPPILGSNLSEELLSTLFFIILMLPVLMLGFYYINIIKKNDATLPPDKLTC